MMEEAFRSRGHADVARFVAARCGLALDRRVSDVEKAIDEGMARAKAVDLSSYLERLRSDDETFDALVDELTIGETYFFRETAHFDVVRRLVIPWLRESARDRMIRVWSAGCSSGEEPYSLAILFEQEELADRLHLVATDISHRALAAARIGRYRSWALRGLDATSIARYFRRESGSFVLDERIRRRVELRHQNLALPGYPSTSSDLYEMDLIFCRNVLLYFDAENVAKVARRLRDSLAPGGWLLTASTDPLLEDCEGHATELGEGYVCYRRRRPSSLRPSAPVRIDGTPPRVELPRSSSRLRVAEHSDSSAAAPHHRHAMVLADAGAEDLAVLELQRAIRLDPSFVASHLVLGALLAKLGDRVGALAAFGIAHDLCGALPPDSIVPCAEGETAGALRVAASNEMRRLERAGTR